MLFLDKAGRNKINMATNFDDTQIPLVDEETEKRIGDALENFKNGEYITVKPDEDISDALNNFDKKLQQEKSKSSPSFTQISQSTN